MNRLIVSRWWSGGCSNIFSSSSKRSFSFLNPQTKREALFPSYSRKHFHHYINNNNPSSSLKQTFSLPLLFRGGGKTTNIHRHHHHPQFLSRGRNTIPPKPKNTPSLFGWKRIAKGTIGLSILFFGGTLFDAFWFGEPDSKFPEYVSSSSDQRNGDRPSSEEKLVYSLQTLRELRESESCHLSFLGSFWRNMMYFCRGVKQVAVFGSGLIVLGIGSLLPLTENLAHCYFVWTLAMCGPFTIKLGQWMSQYKNVIGERLASKLKQFQSYAPSHPLTYTNDVLKRHKKLEEAIQQLQSEEEGGGKEGEKKGNNETTTTMKLLASGSIAQVYHTTLPNRNGLEVILKVRHPGIIDAVYQDISMLWGFLGFVGWLSPRLIGWLRPQDPLAEFSCFLIDQLDMSREARNLETFRSNFKNRGDISFPEPLMDLCSSEILVETFESGVPAEEFVNQSDCTDKTRKLLSRTLIQNYLKMAATDNFSHDDLHGGNLLLRWVKDDRGLRQKIVDFFVDKFSEFNANRRFRPEIGGFIDPAFSLHSLFKENAGAVLGGSRNVDSSSSSSSSSSPAPSPPSPAPSPPSSSPSNRRGERPQIVVIDCGAITQLSPTDWRNFVDLFENFMKGKSKEAASILVDRVDPLKKISTPQEEEDFIREVTQMFDDVFRASFRIRRIAVGETLMTLLVLSKKYRIPLDPVFTSRLLGTFLVESLSKDINPEVDFLTEGAAFFASDHETRRRMIRRTFNWFQRQTFLFQN